MPTAPKVILYSTSLHTWEVWSQSRPLAQGSLKSCRDTYPDAEPVSDHQRLLAIADEFLIELPWLRDGRAVLDMCVQVSEHFVSTLAEHGIAAETISGMLMGTAPEFEGETLVLAGHYAVLVHDQDSAGQPADVVYDWTARQFDPSARVPLVQPLTQWRETWLDPRSANSYAAKSGASE